MSNQLFKFKWSLKMDPRIYLILYLQIEDGDYFVFAYASSIKILHPTHTRNLFMCDMISQLLSLPTIHKPSRAMFCFPGKCWHGLLCDVDADSDFESSVNFCTKFVFTLTDGIWNVLSLDQAAATVKSHKASAEQCGKVLQMLSDQAKMEPLQRSPLGLFSNYLITEEIHCFAASSLLFWPLNFLKIDIDFFSEVRLLLSLI